MSNYILIVEDDNDISQMLRELLQQEGYAIKQAYAGTEALFYLEKECPKAVILDLMLPGISGEELLSKIKTAYPQTAVIVEAVLRRSAKEQISEKVLQYKDIVMFPDKAHVTVAGVEIKLTRREFLILKLLMENSGKVFTKSNIYESVWNEEFLGEDNAVNVHISNLRQKIAKVNNKETYIETVWGIGFKMK